jgi:hypothetical protein
MHSFKTVDGTIEVSSAVQMFGEPVVIINYDTAYGRRRIRLTDAQAYDLTRAIKDERNYIAQTDAERRSARARRLLRFGRNSGRPAA